jgi:hypothetical protein
MESNNTPDNDSNYKHQPDWEESLQRLEGLDVVVQLLESRQWIAKTTRAPICMAHGTTMFEAILNLDRVVSAGRMSGGNLE